MAVHRKNKSINDAVEVLDDILAQCNDDIKLAWSRLGKDSIEFIQRELYKCKIDERYYLENYHVIMTEDQGLHCLYPLWDSQEMFYNKILELKVKGAVRLLVLKARQLGSSTVSQGLTFHKTIFTEAVNTIIVAQDPVTADHLFSMSRTAYDNLPWWMRPEERYQAKGRYLWFDKKDDMERRRSPGLKSKIIVEAANKLTSPGRGQTFRCVHFSELAEWLDGGVLSESLFPTMNARDGLYIMEGTAKGRVGFFYKYWKATLEGKTNWEPLFIPYYKVKKYSVPILEAKRSLFQLTEEEQGIKKKVQDRDGFTISDETFNWARLKKEDFISVGQDEFRFMQEYPLGWQEAFQGTGICAFPKRKLQTILDTQCCDPLWFGEIYFDFGKPVKDRIKVKLTPTRDKDGQRIQGLRIPPAKTEGGRLRVWELPESGEDYYLAADVAHGVEGGDFSCIQILRIGRGQCPDEQVAEWRGWINPTPFGHIVAAMGYWYNEAQVAVECNDVGQTTNNEVFRIIEYENMYRWKHIDKVKNFMTDFLGWYTNSKTRDTIISKTREAIMENTIVLRSEELLDEMFDFSQDDGGGRFEGQDSHDDRVMALLVCRYCAHESDFGKEASAAQGNKTVAGKSDQRYYIYDQYNRCRYQIDNKEDAETIVKGNVGWSLKTLPSARDNFNTEFSPVHDKAGIQQRLHYEQGIPADKITDDMVRKAQAEFGIYSGMGVAAGDEPDWRSV